MIGLTMHRQILTCFFLVVLTLACVREPLNSGSVEQHQLGNTRSPANRPLSACVDKKVLEMRKRYPKTSVVVHELAHITMEMISQFSEETSSAAAEFLQQRGLCRKHQLRRAET